MAALLSLQLPAVQTGIASYVTQKLEGKFDGEIHFSGIKILPISAVVLNDVVVTDNAPYQGPEGSFPPVDTLFYARKVSANIYLGSLLRKRVLRFGRVTVENGFLHLAIEPDKTYGVNLTRIFRIPLKPEAQPDTSDIFHIRRVRVDDFRYRMTIFGEEGTRAKRKPFEIAWEDLDVNVDARVHSLKFKGGRMGGVADHLRLTEKSGFHCAHLAGTALVGRGEARITNLKILEDDSNVDIPLLLFSYKNSAAWSNFLDDVRITGKIAPSLFALRTLRFYTPVFEKNGAVLQIKKSDVDGPVRHLSVSNFEFRDTVSRVTGYIDARGDGLPELDDIRMNVRLRDWRFNRSGINRFINHFTPDHPLNLKGTLPETWYVLNSHTHGHIDHFNEELTLRSGIGGLEIASALTNITNGKAREIEAQIRTEALDLGAILRTEALGPLSADTKGFLRMNGGTLQAAVDSCAIASLRLLGHNFHNIRASGDIDGKNFNASLRVGDRACRLSADASCRYDEEREERRYNIAGVAGDIDLHAFGIEIHKGLARAAFGIDGEMTMAESGSKRANLKLGNLQLTDSTGVHILGDVNADYFASGSDNRIQLASSFLEGSLRSERKITEMPAALTAQTIRAYLPLLIEPTENAPETQEPFRSELSLKTGSTRELLDFLYPSMYIERGTALQASTDANGKIRAELRSGRIIADGIRVRDIALNADNSDGKLNTAIGAEELELGPLLLYGSRIQASAKDNKLDLKLAYTDVGGYEDELEHSGNLSAEGELLRDSRGKLAFRVHPQYSRFMLGKDLWTLGESELRIGDGRLALDHFSLDCNQQHIRINGGLAPDQQDTMKLFVQNFDLETVDRMTHGVYGLGGSLSADAAFISPISDERVRLSLGLFCEELSLNRVDAGSILVDGRWNERMDRLDFNLQNSVGNYQCMDGHGWFSPTKESLSADLELDKLNIAVLGPFLRDLFSETGGSISGRILAEGKIGDISLSSRDTRLNDALLRIAYTGVGYRFDGPIRISDRGVVCDNLRVSDAEGGKATLNGGLSWDHFKDMRLDARLQFTDMELLDSQHATGKGLYGKLFASGNARVQGPTDNLDIEAEARSSRPGVVTLGSDDPTLKNNNGLLTFVAPKVLDDELLAFEKRAEETKRSGKMNLKAHLMVNPQVTINMPIDTESGSGISANGQGDITVRLPGNTDELSLYGAYQINSGKFNYIIPGLVSKEFVLQDGSSINFGGNLMNTELNVNALYKVSTSLSSLIADSTSTNIRRHVNCGIQISDKLSGPKASFSIDVPDLDPATKSEVQAALNTEDKVQKQFVALLIFGTFIPSENSGVVNGSNILYSNLSEIMMNQVNNVLSKLNIPVDLGFGYQQGTAGNDVFDVAVSTQLFNNRVVVNGSMGNRKYKTSTSPGGDFVGDLDIEVKIDKPGRYRVNLFSHSADEYASYLDQSQRNGLGFTYQQEFNNMGTFFRNIFTSKKKRKAEEAAAKREPVVIKVE